MISANKSQDSGIPPSCLRVIYGYSISRSTGHVWSSLWLQLYYSRRVGSVELAFKTCCLETKPHWAAILTIRDLCQKTRHSVYGKAYGAFALLYLQKDPGLQLIMSCWKHIPKKKSRVKQTWNKTSQEKRFFFQLKSTNRDISNETFHRLVSLSCSLVDVSLQEDPAWQCFRVVLSGPETPGEGEHKIMDYIRKAKVWFLIRLDFAAALIFWFCHVVFLG